MSIDIFKEQGTPVDKQEFDWKDLVQVPFSKLDDDAFTRVRVILMNGVEQESVRFSHACARMNDELRLRMPGGRAVTARIARIVDLQLDQGVYMTRSAWEKLNLKPFTPTAVLLRGDELRLDIARDMDGVVKARTLGEERDTGRATLAIMNVIVLLLVVFSGALELLVFYNLGQLNFSERTRELATLKVLGFTPREIKKLVLRENIVITMMGLPLGLMLGPFFLQALLTYGLPSTIVFVPHLSLASWLYTTCITIAFALTVNWMLGSKFRRVDMVEALKSVE